MLFIFFDLRYQRQLARICPEVLSSFLSSLADSVRRNGGSDCKISTGFLYRFDTDSIGYVFSASRVIADLQQLLVSFRERIQNYFILVDAPSESLLPEAFIDSIADYRNNMYPEEGILITTAAAALLRHYCSTVQVQGTSLSFFTGVRSLMYAEPPAPVSGDKNRYSLFISEKSDPVRAILDLVLGFEPLPAGSLLPREYDSYEATAKALSMYRKYRFSESHPAYLITACLEHAALYFRALKNRSGSMTEIEIHTGSSETGSAVSAEIQTVLGTFGEYCVFRYAPPLKYMPPDIVNMPDDLLELVWIVFRSTEFLFTCEIPDLFKFLGKNSEFLESLGCWMYSYGLLSNPRDFRTLNYALKERVEDRLASRIGVLSRSVANYVWSCYENGAFLAVPSGYRILVHLGYTVPDHFIVRCLCSSGDSCLSDPQALSLVSDRQVVAALEKLELAGKKFREGLTGEAHALAKDSLLVFQKEEMTAAEFKVFSLMSLFSLTRKNGSDAIVYAEYALENALSLMDPNTVITARCNLSVMHFLNGNLHSALCALDAASKIAEDGYVRDYEIPLLFMRGRMLFELGDYRKAEACFASAEKIASGLALSGTACLSRVWVGRCIVHQGRYQAGTLLMAECSSTCADALIYLLEAAILSGDEIDLAAFPEKFPVLSVPQDSVLPAVSGSFSLAEDLCFGASPESAVGERMYRAFRHTVTCQSDTGPAGSAALQSLSSVAQTAQDEKDPYAALYYYLCYEAGSKIPGVPRKETELFLSRSFKALQIRAKEISDNNLREQFMQQPVWNARLYRAARTHMLI